MPDLLPPAAQKPEELWTRYLSQTPVVTHGLNQWRYNRFNSVALFHFKQQFDYPVQVPHPQHKDYSSIETAKRERKEAMRTDRIRRIRQMKPQRRELPDMIYEPNLTVPNYGHVMRIRLPRGLM